MLYKVASETTYEKMGGGGRKGKRGKELRERERERERERVVFLVYALSSNNGLRFTHLCQIGQVYFL